MKKTTRPAFKNIVQIYLPFSLLLAGLISFAINFEENWIFWIFLAITGRTGLINWWLMFSDKESSFKNYMRHFGFVCVLTSFITWGFVGIFTNGLLKNCCQHYIKTMLNLVLNPISVLACSADCPADNHARPLAQFLYGTLYASARKTFSTLKAD